MTSTLLLSALPTLLACAVLGAVQLEPDPPQTSHVSTVVAPAGSASDESCLVNAPIATYQRELLSVAFEAATVMPVQPHLKNRSKAQEAVVVMCLALDQPRQALEFSAEIGDWRRGMCYAHLASYCAEHGHLQEVQGLLDRAAEISESADDWRRDRIRGQIAATLAWLGKNQQAGDIESSVPESERGKVAVARAMRLEEEKFAQEREALDAGVATGNFELVKNALDAWAQIFNRFYGDEARRSLAEQRITAAWGKLPYAIRLQLITQLTEFALDHEDAAKALNLLDQAQRFLDEAQWLPEDRIPLMARLAGLRHRAGDTEQARRDLNAALALFESKRDMIVDVFRGRTLRPIAETLQIMGEAEAALDMYGQVVQVGVENPNSRPRAEDLSATCCSMALHRIEPDADLWSSIRQIRAGLSDPW